MMRREDLMKPDLLSDCLIVMGGLVMIATLLGVLILSFSHTAAMQ